MKLVGQWFGGSNYGRPHADDFEHFSSLRHALVVVEGIRDAAPAGIERSKGD